MKTIKGDLISLAEQGEFDVIVHGCNCFCNMGAGIAKSIKQRCKEAYLADKQTQWGDINKLGTITSAKIEPFGYEVVNAYTQYKYTRHEVDVDYKALRSCFKNIYRFFKNSRIGVPLIGAGLAGGDWNIISKIIEEELPDVDLTLVLYDKKDSR